MSLANLLTAEQIIPEMKATERWAAIVELIDLLVSLGKIKTEDRDPILASLKQREETMSTGIGFGIAIPHCSSDLNYHAKLSPPVPDVIVADHFVPEKRCDARQCISKYGAADVADMHRLGHVGRTEINHNAPR